MASKRNSMGALAATVLVGGLGLHFAMSGAERLGGYLVAIALVGLFSMLLKGMQR